MPYILEKKGNGEKTEPLNCPRANHRKTKSFSAQQRGLWDLDFLGRRQGQDFQTILKEVISQGALGGDKTHEKGQNGRRTGSEDILAINSGNQSRRQSGQCTRGVERVVDSKNAMGWELSERSARAVRSKVKGCKGGNVKTL